MRPASDRANWVLRGLSEDVDRAGENALQRPGLVFATSDQKNAETLERMSGYLGLVAMGQIKTENRQLRILAVNSRTPGASNSDDPENAFLVTLRLVSTKALSTHGFDI